MKRIQIVRDSKGEVVATAELTPGEDVPAEAVLEKGQSLEEIEVPSNYILAEMKKIQIVRDSKGKVVAAAELTPGEDVPAEVVLEEGQDLEEIEVPGDYMLELDAFLERYSKAKKS